jgi:hypothetical protein
MADARTRAMVEEKAMNFLVSPSPFPSAATRGHLASLPLLVCSDVPSRGPLDDYKESFQGQAKEQSTLTEAFEQLPKGHTYRSAGENADSFTLLPSELPLEPMSHHPWRELPEVAVGPAWGSSVK